MPFNVEEFVSEDFKFRTEKIPVPEFKRFFKENDEPAWEVRNLTAYEMAQIRGAMARNRQDLQAAIVKVLNSMTEQTQDLKEKTDALIKGMAERTPDDYVMRLRLLMYGSVNPAVTMELAKKVADVNFKVFDRLTDKILELTGEGKDLGK